MKTPANIHISSVERLLRDGIITPEEYKAILNRIAELNCESLQKDK